VRALNIDVPEALVKRWIQWFSPAVQPFLADAVLADSIGVHAGEVSLSDEVRDTYCLYGLPSGVQYVWLTEPQFMALPRRSRAALVRAQRTLDRELVPSVRSWVAVVGDRAREQADGHRFVWWPSLLNGCEEQVLTDYIEEGRRASRHDQVPEEVWDSAARTLPDARRIAGSFATTSGPNCFGTVMAAAGVVDADKVWMQREPFERWRSEKTRPHGDDTAPGTVLVWRPPDGLVQHAAVTLGDGWVLHKPSQGWMSPNKVLTTHECKASSRASGRRLERYAITA
jgi:cell wall-associated NlpC family hydrolase